MIPRDYITEWRAEAPWVQDSQVEQDLVISRALVEIFSHPLLAVDFLWDIDEAAAAVLSQLIQLLPGDAWRGFRNW